MSDTYQTAMSLAADLAEDNLAANISEMFIEHGKARAAEFRAASEAGLHHDVPAVREYENTKRAIYGAVYDLLNGYKGWKLVKTESP